MALISVVEAAKVLGVSEETVKRRIRRGELQGQQYPRPQGHVWMVDLPSDPVNSTIHHDIRTTPREFIDHDTDPAVRDGEISRLEETLSILRTQVEAQEKYIEGYQQQLDAKDRQIEQLHVLLQQAQAALSAPKDNRRSWWRLLWRH